MRTGSAIERRKAAAPLGGGGERRSLGPAMRQAYAALLTAGTRGRASFWLKTLHKDGVIATINWGGLCEHRDKYQGRIFT